MQILVQTEVDEQANITLWRNGRIDAGSFGVHLDEADGNGCSLNFNFT